MDPINSLVFMLSEQSNQKAETVFPRHFTDHLSLLRVIGIDAVLVKSTDIMSGLIDDTDAVVDFVGDHQAVEGTGLIRIMVEIGFYTIGSFGHGIGGTPGLD